MPGRAAHTLSPQSLNQNKAALEGLLVITRKAFDGIDHQASLIRERSMSLAEETLRNTFDFTQKQRLGPALAKWHGSVQEQFAWRKCWRRGGHYGKALQCFTKVLPLLLPRRWW